MDDIDWGFSIHGCAATVLHPPGALNGYVKRVTKDVKGTTIRQAGQRGDIARSYNMFFLPIPTPNKVEGGVFAHTTVDLTGFNIVLRATQNTWIAWIEVWGNTEKYKNADSIRMYEDAYEESNRFPGSGSTIDGAQIYNIQGSISGHGHPWGIGSHGKSWYTNNIMVAIAVGFAPTDGKVGEGEVRLISGEALFYQEGAT